jgi:hypothetical protein
MEKLSLHDLHLLQKIPLLSITQTLSLLTQAIPKTSAGLDESDNQLIAQRIDLHMKSGQTLSGLPIKTEIFKDEMMLMLFQSGSSKSNLSYSLVPVSQILAVTVANAESQLRVLSQGVIPHNLPLAELSALDLKRRIAEQAEKLQKPQLYKAKWEDFQNSLEARWTLWILVQSLSRVFTGLSADSMGREEILKITSVDLSWENNSELKLKRNDNQFVISFDFSRGLPQTLDQDLESIILKLM